MARSPRIAVVGSANTDLTTFSDTFPRPGDAFIGSFSVFLAESLPEEEALSRANLHEALSTTRIGTRKSFPKRAEFEAEWSRLGGKP